MLNRRKYFRRRQFVVGPRFIDYEGWKKLGLFGNHVATVHPDLQMTIAESQSNKAVLFGYAIDPYRPDASDEDILTGLVAGPLTLDRIVKALKPLTGRFVLIASSPAGKWLFHDACGLRQVNYHVDSKGSVWCASQPDVLAEQLTLPQDGEAFEFRNIPAYRKTKEDFTLIGERTPVRDVKYLLPNHYLDLESGEPARFWPVPGCINSLSPEEAIESGSTDPTRRN